MLVLAAWAQAFFCWPIIDRGFVEPKLAALFATMVWISCQRLPARAARPLLALCAVATLSWWYSISTQLSLYGLPVQPGYGLMAMGCLAVVYAHSHISPVQPRQWAWLALALGVLAILERLGQDPMSVLAHHDPRLAFSRMPAGRVVGWVGSPVDLGAILAMLLAFCGPIPGAFVVVGLWLTGSRGAWLAAACGLLARRWPKLTTPILVVSCFIIFLQPRNLDDRARAAIWRGAAHTFWHGPLSTFWHGAGPSTFVYSFSGEPRAEYSAIIGPTHNAGHAHNDLLEALSATGLLGLICYLWFLRSLTWVPALVALFVNMKVNPMGIDVLVIGAMIAGGAL